MRIPKPAQFLLIVLLALGCYFLAPQGMAEPARRTLFVFVIAALFWSLEIIPLYATSLAVVLLLTFLLCRPDGILGMDAMGYQVFMLPFGSPVIMLFFGGLVLAAAMQKYGLDRLIARNLLYLTGDSPFMTMAALMGATAFLSMWMSNTATTAMMIAMVLPLIRQLDAGEPFRNALVLCIPFAANIGGIATPIGTPPNAIALGILANEGIEVSFIGWMKMGVPLAVLILAVIAATLYALYPPRQKKIAFQLKDTGPLDAPGKQTAWIVLFTAGLWLTSEYHKIPAALTALLAAGLLSATGLLGRDDFKQIDWDVLVLMWGGLALGKGLEISGLNQYIVNQPFFAQKGFWLVAVFAAMSVAISTFMSNTATANLIIPVAVAIPGADHIILATTIALSCSLAMALPVSTPPNAMAYASGMLKSSEMLKSGLIVSLVSLILLLMGYQFMITKAFAIG
jgi:sodium-dependent dicarboxylate transporter 2/3/5